jgi:ATP-binding cassette, subfamily B, bacterial PglK
MLEILRDILNILNRKEKNGILIVFISCVCMAFMETAGVASIVPFISVISNPDIIQSNVFLKIAYNVSGVHSNIKFMMVLGFILILTIILSNIVKAVTQYLILRYNNALYASLSRKMLTIYLSKPYIFFLNQNSSDLGSVILTEVRNFIEGLVGPGIQIISNMLISVLIFSLLIATDPIFGITVIATLGICYYFVFLFVKSSLDKIGVGQIRGNRGKFKAVSEAIAGIKEIKILGKEISFIKEFSLHAESHAKLNAQAGVIARSPRYVLESVAFGGIIVATILKLNNESGIDSMMPLLSIYAFAGYRLLPALQQVFSDIASVRVNLGVLKILKIDIGEVPEKEILAKLDFNSKANALGFSNVIQVKNVSFAYPGRANKILCNFNISILKNTKIGIVGSTGSGKSTLVDILMALLEPEHGLLLVDGVPIDRTNASMWQKSIGYVPQMIFLSDDSVARNIALGVPNEDINMNAIKKAAIIANIDKFIEECLPKKYDTIIGEKGIRISGGQRQRIGIARAVYNDPELIVFDEATSSLDNETESVIVESINTMSKNKTIIIVAHRISSLKYCDKIFVIEDSGLLRSLTFGEIYKERQR